ncbi:MAG TPA: condensation domain-containing protein, partial [Candidatus Sulfotelmatobacter sp.]|nr:condensation domain-containing protein [Candidatus Sulfotelmatobacter sp.]
MRSTTGTLAEGFEADPLAVMPETTGVFPLSQAQESVWFEEQMAPGTGAYNIPEGWRLRGHLRLEALQWSLEQILHRHEAIRTVFGVREGKPVQIILPPGPFALRIVDLRLRTAREVEVEQLMGAEARRPFDLARGPLLRVTLFRLAEQEYVMVVNMHHLVSDAWSQGVFLRELAQLYSARVAGKTAPLSELPIQFVDFVMWQREGQQGPAHQQALTYWEKQLQRCPPLEFPTDYARPGSQSFRGATLFFTLPQELVEAVKELSRRQGTTWFMTLLAAYQVLLRRYTRQEDIVVGSPFAGRDRVEAEGLIGFFVNTHALRTDLSGDPTFVELLGRVREVVLAANAYQEVPLEHLVRMIQPDRDLGRHPLFQTVFGLQTALAETWRLPELELTRLELDNGAAKFDLTLLLSECSQGLRVRCEYSTDLFKAGTIARLMRQFQTLLEGIVTAPQKRLSELPLLTSVERQQLLVGWNQTANVYERERCVQEVFEAQAAKTPEAIALAFAGQQLTYGELNRRANQLAWRLRACGVGPDLLVGVCLERSWELIIAMLAILKAGGAYLPLDRTYPKERLAFMLEDAGAPVLVTDSGFEVSGMPVQPERIVYVDAEQGSLAQESAENPPICVRAVNLAYVMYTSGSTGTPKGVQIPHRGVVRLVRNSNYAEFLSTDTFLQLAPISFDASTLEIWGALLNGARLVIFPPHLPSLEELGRTLVQEQISTLWLTAGLFHQMIDQQLDSLRGLRQLLAGGDVLSVPHVVRAVRELSGCRLINGYGPTENTTFTCCYPIPASWPGGRSVPIGRPIGNTQVYVLDQHFEPVPVGVPGELLTGGDGL